MKLSHIEKLESESIHIIREVVAEFENPVMLYSIGKDSSVMLHLAQKAFAPNKIPFKLMHIDTTWKFKEMIFFREETAKKYNLDLLVHINEEGVRDKISPITHGSKIHTDIMKTQALKQALDKYRFDAAFGGARRDEEKSRSKERIFSFRDKSHRWDPKNQKPELWNLFNTKINKDESVLIIDDLIATGGTAEAAAKLIEISGGKVSCFIFVINLFDLKGSDNLIKKGYKVENLIEFPGH